jgi:hypothetical protein
MKKGLLLLFLFILYTGLFAASNYNDTLLVQRAKLLNLIAAQQSNQQGAKLKGSFPSFRKYYYSSNLKEEDNVFFTALVLLNSGQFKAFMSPAELIVY